MPKTEELLVLDPNKINIGWRARAEMRDLKELAASIKQIGQLQPVVVNRNKDGEYELIAGERRVQACRLLEQGVKAISIEVSDAADALWRQLVENVQRNDFTMLELGEGLRKHKRLYEEEHPVTKVGQSGRRGSGAGETVITASRIIDETTSGKEKPPERYTRVAANDLGVSEIEVQRSLRLATELTDKRKREIRKIADPKKRRKAEYGALQSMAKERRVKKLHEKAASRAADREAVDQTESRMDLGNCRDIMKSYAAQGLVFDAVITDPPYGLNWSHIEHTCRSDINASPSWDDLDVGWVFDLVPLLADDAVVVIFSPAEAMGTYQEALYECGLRYRGPIVWWKTNPAPVHRPGNYISATEYAIWATKGRPYFKEWENAGVEAAHNAFRSPICQGIERLEHETQKPEIVIDRFIDRHVQEGDYVLDPFMGTGTTLVCCKRRGIPCAGIEMDKRIFELAKARVMAL